MRCVEMGLRRERRLRRNREIRRVLNRGRRVVRPAVVLYWMSGGTGPSRVAFVVGRKLGKAVERNRLRRLFREALRSLIDGLPDGLDLVFVVRARAAGMDYKGARAVAEDLLAGAGLAGLAEAHGGAAGQEEGAPC